VDPVLGFIHLFNAPAACGYLKLINSKLLQLCELKSAQPYDDCGGLFSEIESSHQPRLWTVATHDKGGLRTERPRNASEIR
jgi:hypothetical protein